MLLSRHHIRQTHRFLIQQGAYPVLLSTALAFSLYLGRVVLSQRLTFLFLVWNLFLAWIPYLASLGAICFHQRYPRKWWLLLPPAALWLAFFPNAPYILTDLLHLAYRSPVPYWYDIGLLIVFAWTGLFLGIYSLRLMQGMVQDYMGMVLGWAFVLISLGLSGLGIYMGRFLRWNSWDLVFHPQEVLTEVVVRLVNPLENLQTVGVTMLFAAILFITYLTLTAMPSLSKPR
jgi:uncharacterized membrane protein